MGPFYSLFALFFSSFSFSHVGHFKKKWCLKHPGNGGVVGAKNTVKNFPGLWWGGSSCELQPEQLSRTLRNL